MAKTLEKFEFTRTVESYPWDEWQNGDTWLIIQGEDYGGKTKQMRERLYAHAKNDEGARVQTQIVDVVYDEDGDPHVKGTKSAPEHGRTAEAIVFRYYENGEEDDES